MVLSASMMLSGCGVMSQLASATPTAAPATTSTPTLTPTTPELEPGTVVATGQLVGDPLITGNVDVRAGRKGSFELRLLSFHSERQEEVELQISPRVVEPGTTCTSSIMNLSFGNLPVGPDQSFPLGNDFTGGDPSFLDTVLITHHDFDAFTQGCFVSVLASATLDWVVPDTRPGLVVIDSGKTGGATGEVTLLDNEPLAYTVAPNDLLEEVAARFGVTVNDIFFLNPTRAPSPQKPTLDIGEVLNLSKGHR